MNEAAPDRVNGCGEKPWRLLMSLAFSLLIVVGGMLSTYHIWTDSNQKFHELFHVEESVHSLQSRLGLQEARVR